MSKHDTDTSGGKVQRNCDLSLKLAITRIMAQRSKKKIPFGSTTNVGFD